MVLKKIDNRIRVLIENGVQLRHRSLVFVVGDKGRDQVMVIFGVTCK
jgi:N-acetyltransferase 10